jgi:hypothetical protein
MNAERINGWLALVANVGVLFGIFLILIELDQNADLMRAQMTQARAEGLLDRYNEIVHSDYWPAITAKRTAASSTEEWLESLTPEEQERVLYTYFREANDIRNQFFQYQEGYLPAQIWHTSSRAQTIRMMDLAVALGRECNADREYQEELNRIAAEEGLPQCNNGIWK